jgi:hypothetical protein
VRPNFFAGRPNFSLELAEISCHELATLVSMIFFKCCGTGYSESRIILAKPDATPLRNAFFTLAPAFAALILHAAISYFKLHCIKSVLIFFIDNYSKFNFNEILVTL